MLPIRVPTAAELVAALPQAIAGPRVRLGELLAALGERGMAWALLVVTLPQLLPIPLGLANVLALPILAVAAQMALGRATPWLPGWLMDRRLDRDSLVRVCERLAPFLRRVETVIRPRCGALWSRRGSRLVGASCFAIAAVSVAPLPLTGWLPAWALVAVAVGMLSRDGLVALAGLALGAAAMAVFLAVLGGVVELGDGAMRLALSLSANGG